MFMKLFEIKNYITSAVYSFFCNTWFDVKFHAACLWYGGEDNIPEGVLETPEERQEWITTLCCLCAYNQICIRLNIDRSQCYIGAIITALFNSGKGLVPGDTEKIHRIIISATKRRTVLELMIEVGDIRKELVDFQVSAEDRDEFNQWLDGSDEEVYEAEPKVQKDDELKQI